MDKPRADYEHPHPARDGGVRESVRQRVESGLRRAIDGVRGSGTLDPDSREQDERAVAAARHVPQAVQQKGTGAEEVDPHHLECLGMVGVDSLLGAQDADRQHHHVEPVGLSKRPLDDRLVLA